MPNCINLRERFGDCFRIGWDESRQGREIDPWLMTILCRYGHIYPLGGHLLAASVDGHPNVAGMMRRLSSCQVIQDGDVGELTAVFNVGDFNAVAQIIQPRRRRRVSLTPEQRTKIGRRLAHGKQRRQTIVGSDPTPRPCDETSSAVQGATSG